MQTLTKKQYERMKRQNEEASMKNDYSKMIMMNSIEGEAMNRYEQDNICKHPDVGTIGGVDYCKICGKQW